MHVLALPLVPTLNVLLVLIIVYIGFIAKLFKDFLFLYIHIVDQFLTPLNDLISWLTDLSVSLALIMHPQYSQ